MQRRLAKEDVGKPAETKEDFSCVSKMRINGSARD
jgi:hypothetical protein